MNTLNTIPASAPAFDPRKIADRVLSLSPVIENKTKMTTDEIMNAYPGRITLTTVDFLTSPKDGKPYAVFNIKEDPTVWFGGGERLTTLFSAYLAADAMAGDLAVLNAYLAENPIAVRLTKGRTKKGNPITLVEVL